MRVNWISMPIVAAALLAATITARAEEPLKIRLGWVVTPASVMPILFEKPGLAQHLGKSYTVEAIHFQGTPPVITGLAAGEVDIGTLAFSAIGIAIVNAKMDDLRIVADEAVDGVPGYNTNEFMVLKDSPIKTVDDLKGKVLATNSVGSAVDIAMRVMLRQHHFEEKTDYTIVEVPFPSMKAFLAEKKTDLISAVDPFSQDPALRQMARTLFTERDAFGQSHLAVWVARAGFLEKNRAAMVDFMEDVLRSIRWYTDPANHKEAIDILAKFTKQPRENFDSWAFTKDDQYRDPNALADLGSIQSNIDKQKEVGFLKADIDVKKHADLSIVKDAAQRLK